MSKNMPPPMKMRVERGRLVPASAYDAERLESYRVGSSVNVYFTADRMRPLERKYRAILGKVVKECGTPWTNAEAAHQALKLACGYVNVGKTASGQFMQWPRSIADFDDQELQDYFESVLVLLSGLVGVDAATLKKETAHIVEHEDHDPSTGEIIEHETTESGSSPHPEPDAEEATPPASSAEGVDPSLSTPSSIPDASTPDGGPASGEDPTGGETAPTQPPAGSPLSIEQRAMLIEAASKFMKLAQEPISFESRLQFLESREADWKDVIDPAYWAKLESLATAARAVINSKRTPAQAFSYIAVDLLDCTVTELGG